MTDPPPSTSRQRSQERSGSSSASPSPTSGTSVSSARPIPVPISTDRTPYPYQGSRSPSSSSFPSYRQHPYTRVPSLPSNVSTGTSTSTSETIPRIHLPAPHSNAPLNVGMGTSLDLPRPPLSAPALGSPIWQRQAPSPPPGVYRSLSDSARGLNLPPLQFPSGPSRIPMAPPSTEAIRSSHNPPSITAGGGRWKDDPYELRSPPLRALPPSGSRSYSPERERERDRERERERGLAPPQPVYYPPSGFSSQLHPGPSSGRSRSHSSTSRRSEEAIEGVIREGAGQTRRMAHLMSEQKRRESINSGFAALRAALPRSTPTDSKAIILRKAVSRIKYLEAALRNAGITSADPPSREEWGEEVGEGDVDMLEGEEGKGSEDEPDEGVRKRSGS